MPLETGTTIAQLNAFWPLSSDPVNQGEDHLQLIKSVLKAQFPGASGNGFSKPIIATEDEINFLDGAKSNIQQQIDDIITGVSGALDAPAGTVMVFGSTIPPGWTKVTTVNDAMMRLVSGTPGGTGGTLSPISMSIQHNHTTAAHQLTNQELPSHAHGLFADADSSQDISPTLFYAAANYDAGTTGANSYRIKGVTSPVPSLGKTASQGGNGSHNHGPTSTLTMSLTPKYFNVNLAIKS